MMLVRLKNAAFLGTVSERGPLLSGRDKVGGLVDDVGRDFGGRAEGVVAPADGGIGLARDGFA